MLVGSSAAVIQAPVAILLVTVPNLIASDPRNTAPVTPVWVFPNGMDPPDFLRKEVGLG